MLVINITTEQSCKRSAVLLLNASECHMQWGLPVLILRQSVSLKLFSGCDETLHRPHRPHRQEITAPAPKTCTSTTVLTVGCFLTPTLS